MARLRSVNLVVAGIVALALSGIGAVAPTTAGADPGSVNASILSGGVVRTYRLYRPASLPANATPPLLIVLHPAGGSGLEVEGLTGFDTVADSAGVVVAYPDANSTGALWAWGCCSNNPQRVSSGDSKFISDLIDTLVATKHVDTSRVYVAGFSIGAVFAHRLACQLSTKITAIATVGGTEQLTKPCAPTRPVSVIDIKGMAADEWYSGSCPVNGNCTPFTQGYTPSATQLDAEWRALDQCAAPVLTDLAPIVHVSTATHCAGNAIVELVSIEATSGEAGNHGHHCWPGGGCAAPPDATSYLWSRLAPLATPVPTTAVVSSANPSAIGQKVTLTGTASSPRGTMRFYDGTTLIGSKSTSTGLATLLTHKLAVGAHAVSVTFTPSPVSTTVVSPTITQTVDPATTVVSVHSNANPSQPGALVTFRATVVRVAPAVGSVTTGTVAFYDGAVLLAAVPVLRRTAAFSTRALASGDHTITVIYSGSSTDLPWSATITQHVN